MEPMNFALPIGKSSILGMQFQITTKGTENILEQVTKGERESEGFLRESSPLNCFLLMHQIQGSFAKFHFQTENSFKNINSLIWHQNDVVLTTYR